LRKLTMTEDEEQNLRALGDDLAAVAQSPWEPRCIARTFSTPAPDDVVFTMQHWIELERLRSPLLLGKIPERIEDLEVAAAVFGHNAHLLSGTAAADLGEVLRAAIAAQFALALPMRPMEGNAATEPDGFGAWLPLFTFLLKDCHLAPTTARALPVGQAFALFAAAHRDEGWRPAQHTYAQRDTL